MRKPRFISPSALSKYQSNVEEYYLQYLADTPPPREGQTQAMSIGSSFDAYVKSYMFETLFGPSKRGSEFELRTIFESQVEEHNREWAWEAGAYAFECYKECGALADLLVELEHASSTPRFEFTVQGTICAECGLVCDNDSHIKVPLLGKPDVWYVDRSGNPIILDFKVNGFCSNYPISPKRGYIKVRGPGNNQDGEHKKAQISKLGGVKINIAEFFECIDKGWSQQLATYAWLCGAPVGSYFIVAIDQLCCNTNQLVNGKWPTIRVAEHRCQIGPAYQEQLAQAYTDLWAKINSDPFHWFEDRPLAESQARCDALDEKHAAFKDGEEWLRDLMR